jgi:hypothetical protein
MIPLEEKFWRKVLKLSCSCWVWTGSWNGWGYGRQIIGNKSVTAHRISYALHNGPIPAGLQVLHKCDIRCCVNPAHLFLGTHDDNMKDASAKGRLTRETIPEEKKKFIRENPHLSQRAVAKAIGVGVGTVCRYRNA